MNLRQATIFDINSIMKIERDAFIPQIQEKKSIFCERIQTFSEGFLLLEDENSTENKKIIGYFCSEIWNFDLNKINENQFLLNHSIKQNHKKNGNCLYISSFAILNEFKGKKLSSPFFNNSINKIKMNFPKITQILLIVNEEWKIAHHIYKKNAFNEIQRIPNFFNNSSEFSDGIVMLKNL